MRTSMKPTIIEVLWSESGRFKDGQVFEFSEFEHKARSIARDVGRDRGYCKTKVCMHLDNGDTISFRIDLAEDDDKCASDVVRSYQNYLRKPEGKEYYNSSTEGGRAFLDAMNRIEL
jgi:hypothetical protein